MVTKSEPIEEEESNIHIQEHQGAPQIRWPQRDMPKLKLALFALRNELMGRPAKTDWEKDDQHHQLVIYLTFPGVHVTKLVPEIERLRAEVDELKRRLAAKR